MWYIVTSTWIPQEKNTIFQYTTDQYIISLSVTFTRLWQITKWFSLQNRIKGIAKVLLSSDFSQLARMFFEVRQWLWQMRLGKYLEHMVTNTQKILESYANSKFWLEILYYYQMCENWKRLLHLLQLYFLLHGENRG